MAYSYRDVLDRWDKARAFGEKRSLPEYSQFLNELYETEDFSEGMRDGWWTRASTRADQFLEGTVGSLTEPVMGALGSAFGYEDVGREIGRKLPRSALNMAGLALGGPIGIGATGLAMGANTFADTGSSKAAAVSGAAGLAIPLFGKLGANIAGRMGGGLVGQYTGSQVGAMVPNTASALAQQEILNPGAPFDWKQFGVETLLSQIPFSVYDVVQMRKAPTAKTPKQVAPVQKQDYRPPSATQEQAETLGKLMQELEKVAKDSTLSAEDRAKATARAIQAVYNPEAVTALKQEVKNQQPAAQVKITGRAVKSGDNYRVLVDSAESAAALNVKQGDTVWVNDTSPEFDPQTGRFVFSGDAKKVRPARYSLTEETFTPKQKLPDPAQPELPVQPPPEPLDPDTELTPVQKPQRTPEQKAQMLFESAVDGGVQAGMLGEDPGIYGRKKTWEQLTPEQQEKAKQKLGVSDPSQIARVPETKPEPTETDIAALQEMGEEGVLGDPNAWDEQLAESAQKWEEAKTQEEAAQQKAVANPTKPEEWVDLVPEDTVPQIKTQVDAGATPTQAVESARLAVAAKETEAAVQKQARAKKAVRKKDPAAQAEELARGNALIELYTKAEVTSPEGPVAAYGTVIRKALQSGDKLDQKFTERIARVVARWQEGRYGGQPTLSNLAGALHRAMSNAQRKPSTNVESYLVNGKRQWGTESEIAKFIQENGLDPAVWKAELPDKETQARRGEKKYFVGKRVYKPGDTNTSLDQNVGEGTATLGDVISSDKSLEPPPNVQSKVTVDDLRGRVEELIADPQDFASEVLREDASPEQVLDVTEGLNQVRVFLEHKEVQGVDTPSFLPTLNVKLKEAGLPEFDTLAEAKHQMQEMMRHVLLYGKSLRGGLEYNRPEFDETLLASTGARESTRKLTEWLSSQNLGGTEKIVKAWLNLPDVDSLQLVLPGHPAFDANKGNYYFDAPGSPYVQLAFLPKGPHEMQDFARIAAHEINHHMMRAVESRQDPAAVEFRAVQDQVLAALRSSQELPLNVRKVLTRALKENHYSKFVKGTFDMRADWVKDLGERDYRVWHNVIYGMLNRHELTSVMFEKPLFVALLKETKLAKPRGAIRTALDWLSDAWNTLWNGKPEQSSALAQLLQGYDNYLTGGLLKGTYNGVDFIRSRLMQEGARPDALASRMQTIERTFTRGDLRPTVTGFNTEARAGKLPVTFAQGELNRDLRDSLLVGEPRDVAERTMNLLAHEVPLHQDLLFRMKQDLDIAEQLHDAIEKGEIAGEIPPGAKENLSKSRVKLNAMRIALRKQELAMDRLANLSAMTPDGWSAMVADGLLEHRKPHLDDFPDAENTRALVGMERLGGKKMSWLAKTFALTQHFKELFPASKPVINGVSDEQARAHSRATSLNAGLFFDRQTGKLSPEFKKTYERVRASEKMTEAASDLFRWQNKEGQAQTLDMNDPFVRQTLGRFNQEDRQAILRVLAQEAQRYAVWMNKVLPQEFGRLNQEDTSTLVAAREPGMLPDTAREWTQELYESLAQMQDPATAQLGVERLRMAATKVQPTTVQAAMQHAQALQGKLQQKLAEMAKKPLWTSEQRYGEDHLVMSGPNGERFRASGDRSKLQRIQSEKAAAGYKFLDYVAAEDSGAPRFGMREDFLRAIEELDAQNEQLLREMLKDKPDMLATVLPRVSRAGDLRASLAAGQPLPSVKRRFVGGREYINMLDNTNQYYVRMNNYLRNRLTRSRSALDMMHHEVQGNAELRRYLEQHVDNFLSPDNPIARKFVEATYFWKLGFDLGNGVLEATQNLTTGMSALIGETGSVGDAFALWKNAIAELTKRKTTGKWANPEHHRLMEVAAEYGKEGLATWADIADQDVHMVLDQGKGPLSVMKNGAKKFSSIFSRFNDRIALISAYDLARAKGMDTEQSIRFAFDVRDRGLFTGGKSQRPVGLWSIKSKPVPQLLSALQTYSLGWFSQMAENYSKGFSRNPPKGLTETQRIGARKAFLYSIAAQSVLAGALGLPGVGQGIALLQQSTGVDLKGWLRQNLASLFGEEEQTNGVLTSLALRGAGSAGLPFDPSSRAAISVPFTGVNAYTGFNVSNLGGAVTATVGDYVEGLLGLLGGDSTAATKMLPNSLKRPAELLLGEGDVRDDRGGLIAQLSTAEQFAMGMGLQPSRVQATKDANEALRKLQRKQTQDRAQLVDSLATLFRKGGPEEVQQALLELKREQPDVDLKELVRSIASRVEAQTIPYDYRRDLNVGAELSGLVNRQPSTELARRQIRATVQQQLGLAPRVNPQADQEAMLVDQLMDSNPLLSRADAKAMVEGSRRAARRSSVLDIPGLQ